MVITEKRAFGFLKHQQRSFYRISLNGYICGETHISCLVPYEPPDRQHAIASCFQDRTEHWPERASYDLVLGADVVYLEVPL